MEWGPPIYLNGPTDVPAPAAVAARDARVFGQLIRELDEQIDREAEAPPPVPLTVEERIARFERLQKMDTLELTAAAPREPAGAGLWAQNLRTRRAEREDAAREKREQAAGLPKIRAKWQARRDAIDREHETALADAQRAHREAEQAAQQARETALADLGDYPQLREEEQVIV
ncbi:MAG TPA: hypothetical protein VGH09_06580 [Solirubrobacteraceae bacterium]|jgi:hypothetical protein